MVKKWKWWKFSRKENIFFSIFHYNFATKNSLFWQFWFEGSNKNGFCERWGFPGRMSNIYPWQRSRGANICSALSINTWHSDPGIVWGSPNYPWHTLMSDLTSWATAGWPDPSPPGSSSVSGAPFCAAAAPGWKHHHQYNHHRQYHHHYEKAGATRVIWPEIRKRSSQLVRGDIQGLCKLLSSLD